MIGSVPSSPAPRPFSVTGRQQNLADMVAERLDVLVVGGGITGAGVALEASRRGYRVGLVEAHDFAWGTSSRSSKLVHGGLRYLGQGEIGLVREALQERRRLSATFPGLVQPLSFLLPIPRDRREAVMLKIGLVLYDLLARGSGFARHRRLSVAEARRLAPALHRADIRGAWLYWDAQTDDARLTLTALRRAADGGALVVNHVRMLEAAPTAPGDWAVRLLDQLTGSEVTVGARILVNATGVWADRVEATAGQAPRAHLRPSKGVHLTLSAEALPLKTAVVFPVGDGRLLFAIPWQGHVVVGTTDADYGGDLAEPACSGPEAAEVLGAVNRFFQLDLGPGAVLSQWAGVRPLVVQQGGGGSATKDLSRKPFIEMDGRGLLTVTGGKLTTFMRMADAALDLVDGCGLVAERPRTGVRPAAETGPGAAPAASAASSLTAARSLPGGSGHTLDDVDRAVGEEMALELDDVLSRRLRLSFLDTRAALAAAPMVAERMAELLSWPDTEARVERFTAQLRADFGLPA